MEETEKCRSEAILLTERDSPSVTVTGGKRSHSESRRCRRSEDRRYEWPGSGESAAGRRVTCLGGVEDP